MYPIKLFRLISGRILLNCAQNSDICFDCDSLRPHCGLPRFRSTGKFIFVPNNLHYLLNFSRFIKKFNNCIELMLFFGFHRKSALEINC